MRAIPSSFANALAAVQPDPPIDVALAREQHAAYCAALAGCGVAVELLPADEACPDCVFVEDTAVVAAAIALITRPGAASRRAEVEPIAHALAANHTIVRMVEPATLDGGDCMQVGDTIYVGRSARTNAAGIAQLAAAFPQLRVVALELPPHVLHLQCVCSPLGPDRILLAEGSLEPSLFRASIVAVPAAELYAANAVAVGLHVVVADSYPRTHDVLARAGFTLHPVPVSEVRKADGSLTCQSIVFS